MKNLPTIESFLFESSDGMLDRINRVIDKVFGSSQKLIRVSPASETMNMPKGYYSIILKNEKGKIVSATDNNRFEVLLKVLSEQFEIYEKDWFSDDSRYIIVIDKSIPNFSTNPAAYNELMAKQKLQPYIDNAFFVWSKAERDLTIALQSAKSAAVASNSSKHKAKLTEILNHVNALAKMLTELNSIG